MEDIIKEIFLNYPQKAPQKIKRRENAFKITRKETDLDRGRPPNKVERLGDVTTGKGSQEEYREKRRGNGGG